MCVSGGIRAWTQRLAVRVGRDEHPVADGERVVGGAELAHERGSGRAACS
jgi:hypothetical protein